VRLLGLPDRFIAHATRQEQLTEAGLDAPNIAAMVKDMIQTANSKHQAAILKQAARPQTQVLKTPRE
jgi:hypothetical protein